MSKKGKMRRARLAAQTMTTMTTLPMESPMPIPEKAREFTPFEFAVFTRAAVVAEKWMDAYVLPIFEYQKAVNEINRHIDAITESTVVCQGNPDALPILCGIAQIRLKAMAGQFQDLRVAARKIRQTAPAKLDYTQYTTGLERVMELHELATQFVARPERREYLTLYNFVTSLVDPGGVLTKALNPEGRPRAGEYLTERNAELRTWGMTRNQAAEWLINELIDNGAPRSGLRADQEKAAGEILRNGWDDDPSQMVNALKTREKRHRGVVQN